MKKSFLVLVCAFVVGGAVGCCMSPVIPKADVSEINQPRYTQGLPITIKQGMPYLEARGILIRDGWQIITMHTTPNGTPSCWMSDWDETKSPKTSCDYVEVDSCSGTGMAFCIMWFFDGEDKFLRVRTVGGEPPEATIDSWEKRKSSPFEGK